LFAQVLKDGNPFGLRQTNADENSLVALVFQALNQKKIQKQKLNRNYFENV
jgi:hypothetical protein